MSHFTKYTAASLKQTLVIIEKRLNHLNHMRHYNPSSYDDPTDIDVYLELELIQQAKDELDWQLEKLEEKA